MAVCAAATAVHDLRLERLALTGSRRPRPSPAPLRRHGQAGAGADTAGATNSPGFEHDRRRDGGRLHLAGDRGSAFVGAEILCHGHSWKRRRRRSGRCTDGGRKGWRPLQASHSDWGRDECPPPGRASLTGGDGH